MRNIIVIAFITLFQSLINHTLLAGQSTSHHNVNSSCDSIVVKGRAIWEINKRGSKEIEPVEGVIFVFVDYEYRDSLLEDSFSNQNIPRESYIVTDQDGCFELKLANGRYIAESSYLGSYRTLVDIQPDDTIIDLGDIEIKERAFDDSDNFVKITGSSRVKLFFRRIKFW